MEKQPKKQPPSEAELRRLLALDRASVEERLAKDKALGRKIGALIAVVLALIAIIIIVVISGVDARR